MADTPVPPENEKSGAAARSPTEKFKAAVANFEGCDRGVRDQAWAIYKGEATRDQKWELLLASRSRALGNVFVTGADMLAAAMAESTRNTEQRAADEKARIAENDKRENRHQNRSYALIIAGLIFALAGAAAEGVQGWAALRALSAPIAQPIRIEKGAVQVSPTFSPTIYAAPVPAPQAAAPKAIK